MNFFEDIGVLMNRFVSGLKIGKELLVIAGLAVVDFFFNFFIFIAEGIMLIITVIAYLLLLVLMLSMSG